MSHVLLLAEARASGTLASGGGALRSLPAWCPLPRTSQHPKVPAVGWVAGRNVSIGDAVHVVTSWIIVESEPPPGVQANPRTALTIGKATRHSAELYALRRVAGSETTVVGAFCSERRFPDALDLGVINDRRHRSVSATRNGGFPAAPAFGRAAVILDGSDEVPISAGRTRLGAQSTEFVLLRGCSAAPDAPSILDSLERATARDWVHRARAEVEHRAALADRHATQGYFDSAPLLADLDRAADSLPVGNGC